MNKELPPGVSKWLEQGKKYKYLDYFKDEIIQKIEKVKDEVRKQTGSFKYDSCYDDCINIINKQ